MTPRSSFFAAAFAIVTVLPGAAIAQVKFRCLLTDLGGSGGWIPSEITVAHDSDKGIVVVSYGLNGEPVKEMFRPRVETDNQKRTTFRWNEAAITATIGANMMYRLTIQKKSLSARVSAIPEGYSNAFQAGGHCVGVKE